MADPLDPFNRRNKNGGANANVINEDRSAALRESYRANQLGRRVGSTPVQRAGLDPSYVPGRGRISAQDTTPRTGNFDSAFQNGGSVMPIMGRAPVTWEQRQAANNQRISAVRAANGLADPSLQPTTSPLAPPPALPSFSPQGQGMGFIPNATPATAQSINLPKSQSIVSATGTPLPNQTSPEIADIKPIAQPQPEPIYSPTYPAEPTNPFRRDWRQGAKKPGDFGYVAPVIPADSAIKTQQDQLKAAGLYSGDSNGQDSPELQSAIRRKQLLDSVSKKGRIAAY